LFDKLGFTFKGATLGLFLLNAALSLLQIMATGWCSANGKYYGYYVDDKATLHSCAWELPARSLFQWVFVFTGVMGLVGLLMDYYQARDQWKEYKEVNLSRITFVVSLLMVNLLLEALANTEEVKYSGGYQYLLFTYFWYLMPVALVMLTISSWSIINKLELIFTLNKRRR
jgi:uncharacterized membrane protein